MHDDLVLAEKIGEIDMERVPFLHLIKKTQAMADLNNKVERGSGRVKRSRHSARVDMTPMVDLMFLLITFFMLTTTLAKPVAMDVAMPDQGGGVLEVSDERTVTICLGKDDKLEWHRGTIEKPIVSPSVISTTSGNVREILLNQSQEVLRTTGDIKKGLIVLIKPSDKSNYKNLVDVIDELTIANVNTYSIVDILPDDLAVMKKNNIY